MSISRFGLKIMGGELMKRSSLSETAVARHPLLSLTKR